MRLLVWALMYSDWCTYEKRAFGCADHTVRGHTKEVAAHKPRSEASGVAKPGGTLISSFQPPEL